MVSTRSILYRCSKGDDFKVAVKVIVPAIAAGSTDEIPVFYAQEDVYVHEFGIIPEAQITGDATNYMTLTFKNKGTSGSGTTSLGSKAFTSGIYAAFDYIQVSTGKLLSEGEVVSLAKSEAGTGMDMPRLCVVIIYSPRSKA